VKPRPFRYHAPRTLPEALQLLGEHSHDAKVIAGGQSLVPVLAMRMAGPEHLVDINRLPGLDRIERTGDRWHIPALVRQRTVERSADLDEAFPLLRQALEQVAHPQIRNRGTVCGSLAHADPAAELPTVMTALGATMHVASDRGVRDISVQDFFQFHFTTALDEDELLVGVSLDDLPEGTSTGFAEFAPRHGDFALAAVAGVVTRDASGAVTASTLVASGVGARPHRLVDAEAALAGQLLDDAAIAGAGRRASAEVDPTGDIHGSADYRRHLVGAMTRRVLTAMVRKGASDD
jgi:carbon-monoxide dehydrogenase medium subunit